MIKNFQGLVPLTDVPIERYNIMVAVCCYKLLLLTSFLLISIRVISLSDSFSHSNTLIYNTFTS